MCRSIRIAAGRSAALWGSSASTSNRADLVIARRQVRRIHGDAHRRSRAARPASRRAIGTRNGEQET